MESKKLGRIGEELATDYLKRNGYKILARNFRCYFGELDIIAKKNTVVCFAEVKTRKSKSFGRPAEAVDRNKRKRLLKIAQYYIEAEKMLDNDVSIDVLEVTYEDGRFCIEHLVNAVSDFQV